MGILLRPGSVGILLRPDSVGRPSSVGELRPDSVGIL